MTRCRHHPSLPTSFLLYCLPSSLPCLPPSERCCPVYSLVAAGRMLSPVACCRQPPSLTTLIHPRHLPPSPQPSPLPHLSRPITPPIPSSPVHSPGHHLPRRHGHSTGHRRGRLDFTSSSNRSLPCPTPFFSTPPSPSIPTALAVPGSAFGSVAAAAAPHRWPVLSERMPPTFLNDLLPTILSLSLAFLSQVSPPNPSRAD